MLAANRVFKRARNKSDRTPLKPLDTKQVHNLRHAPEYCKADYIDSRALARKRAIVKKGLTEKDYELRKQYVEELLGLRNDDTVLIPTDETPCGFGGDSTKQHVTAPVGETVFTTARAESFTRMQWAGACSDTRVRRPHLIWEPEKDEQTLDLAKQLEEQNALAQEEVQRQIRASEDPNTPESRMLQEAQSERDRVN